MAALLELLQGPTKALVASALTGAAAELVLKADNPALCYAYRPAYDDEAFQSMYGSPQQRALASCKPKRPVGKAALSKLKTPGHVAFTFGRNIGLTALITVNRWILAALEEEEAAEAEGREPQLKSLTIDELTVACSRGAYNGCIELAVQATRALLDAQAVDSLSPAVAKRLIKDLKQSAARKGRLAWYIRAPRVARTAFYSEATWWAADFLVSCAQEAYALLYKAGDTLAQRLRRLAARCGLHAVRVSLVLTAVSLGNGVGAASPRFRGFTMWLAAMAASFAVNGYMLALMNRWVPVGGTAGPGAGAAAAGDAAAGSSPRRIPAPPRLPGGGVVLVGRAVHPDAAAAAAVPAAAAGDGGPPAPEPQIAAEAAGPAQHPRRGAGAVAAGLPPLQPEAGGQAAAAAADAAEPPIPAPQQRRVVGGPRLPDRPARQNAAAGPDAPAGAPANAAAAQGPGAPPPTAPATPQFRTDQRAPTPVGDSEETEARGAAAAMGGSPASGTPGAASTASSGELAGSLMSASSTPAASDGAGSSKAPHTA